MKLTAGSTYTIALEHSGAKTAPYMRVYGPTYPEIKWTKPKASTAQAELTAQNGTYQIHCYCPTSELCDFTLTILRK